MEMQIRDELLARLKAKELTFEDLFAELYRVLALSHSGVGISEAPAAELPVLDGHLQIDAGASGNQYPRSVLERVLWRFRGQYWMDKHNLENYAGKQPDPKVEAERHRLGIGSLEDHKKWVACQEVWIWVLQQEANIVEHGTLDSIIATQERMRREKEKGEDRPEGDK